MVVAVKLLHNFSNSDPNDPHTFNEELKIKFGAVSTIVRKSPKRNRNIGTFTQNGDSITRLGCLLCDVYT